MRIEHKIKNDDGKSYVLSVILITIIVLIGFVFFEYLRLTIIVKNVYDSYLNEIKNITTFELKNAFSELREFNYDIDDDDEILFSKKQEILERLNKYTYFLKTNYKKENDSFFVSDVDLNIKRIKSSEVKDDVRTKRYMLSGKLLLSVPLSKPFDNLPSLTKWINIKTVISGKY